MEIINAIIDFLKIPGAISLIIIGAFMTRLKAKAH